jgi:DNA-binding NarL/FixJ family response regulator
MPSPGSPSTTYVLYRNAIFARGIQASLEDSEIPIVGMASEPRAAIEEIRTLRPEVVILEAPSDDGDEVPSGVLLDLLGLALAGRVVVLRLFDETVTVYCRKSTVAAKSVDLVSAVQGRMPPCVAGCELT